ncbi:MAG: hypothetical protein WC455_20130 [Dehalococcoidia bacterium]|jgi:hypothetical protein
MIYPDDQMLDYFLHMKITGKRIRKAREEVKGFFIGYHYWAWRARQEIV